MVYVKVKWISLLILILINGALYAQGEFEKGKQAFEAANYEKALQYFQIAINAEDHLKGNKVAEAYFYRAKSRMMLLQLAAKTGDEKQLKTHQTALVLAYQDLVLAKDKNEAAAFRAQIVKEERILFLALLNGGAGFLNRLYTDPNLTPSVQMALLDLAQPYLAAAKKMRPEDYRAFGLYGQVMMLKRDSEQAKNNFLWAIEKYAVASEEIKTLKHFNIYANLALLATNDKQHLKALTYLEQGHKNLDLAYHKIKGEKSSEKQQYIQVKKDYERLEIEIYLKTAALLKLGIAKFEERINHNSENKIENYDNYVNYGYLLEHNGEIDKGIACYQNAVKINPTKFVAYYNQAALYLVKADRYEGAKKENNTRLSIKNHPELKAFYKHALSLFEQAHQLAPNNIKVLNGLVFTTARLEMKDAYINYRTIRKALKKRNN